MAELELAYRYQTHPGLSGTRACSRTELGKLQLRRLNETLAWAREHSSFHRSRLSQDLLISLEDIRALPLMDASDLAQGMAPFLCVGQSEVRRIVTLATSGTTGTPKRIAFSEREHKDTVAFLASGMRMLVEEHPSFQRTPSCARVGTALPAQTEPLPVEKCIAVLFPCERPGGLGQLICESIEQVPARACAYGLPDANRGFAHLAQTCQAEQVHGLVGFPHHIYALAVWCEHHGIELPIRSVLPSADNVAPSLKRTIQRVWGARVFAHYGTTEMGYGGAVECSYGTGQHIRETELYYEVINPESGEVLPVGEWGELVFTTLNRRAMPFIRYRTGDKTRLLGGACACGSILRRIDAVQGRIDDQCPFTLYELEDALFAESGVLDFAAGWNSKTRVLTLEVQQLPGFSLDLSAVCRALSERAQTTVQLTRSTVDEFKPQYSAKRFIKT